MSSWKLVTGNSDKPFFEQNPDIKYFPEVNKLVEKYGEEDAGKIMWAINMTEDIKGTFYGLEKELKQKYVNDLYLKDINNFDWDDPLVTKVIERYPDRAMPPEKRRYKRLQDSFDLQLKQLNEDDKDTTMALQRLQKMLEQAKESWLKEDQELEQARGSKQPNSFWSGVK